MSKQIEPTADQIRKIKHAAEQEGEHTHRLRPLDKESKRQEYEMTEGDLATLLEASKPTPAMYLSGGMPMTSSPQENANRAWSELGKRMGFDPMTVRPVPGKSQRFFTAEASHE